MEFEFGNDDVAVICFAELGDELGYEFGSELVNELGGEFGHALGQAVMHWGVFGQKTWNCGFVLVNEFGRSSVLA